MPVSTASGFHDMEPQLVILRTQIELILVAKKENRDFMCAKVVATVTGVGSEVTCGMFLLIAG
jgi:hypothetical protein